MYPRGLEAVRVMLLWQECDMKMKITNVQKKFTLLKAGPDSL